MLQHVDNKAIREPGQWAPWGDFDWGKGKGQHLLLQRYQIRRMKEYAHLKKVFAQRHAEISNLNLWQISFAVTLTVIYIIGSAFCLWSAGCSGRRHATADLLAWAHPCKGSWSCSLESEHFSLKLPWKILQSCQLLGEVACCSLLCNSVIDIWKGRNGLQMQSGFHRCRFNILMLVPLWCGTFFFFSALNLLTGRNCFIYCAKKHAHKLVFSISLFSNWRKQSEVKQSGSTTKRRIKTSLGIEVNNKWWRFCFAQWNGLTRVGMRPPSPNERAQMFPFGNWHLTVC